MKDKIDEFVKYVRENAPEDVVYLALEINGEHAHYRTEVYAPHNEKVPDNLKETRRNLKGDLIGQPGKEAR